LDDKGKKKMRERAPDGAEGEKNKEER